MENIFNPLAEFTLNGTLHHFAGSNAIIILKDKQTLLWPIKKLPDDIKEGEIIKLIITTDKLEEKNREQAQKNLLNQILKKE